MSRVRAAHALRSAPGRGSLALSLMEHWLTHRHCHSGPQKRRAVCSEHGKARIAGRGPKGAPAQVRPGARPEPRQILQRCARAGLGCGANWGLTGAADAAQILKSSLNSDFYIANRALTFGMCDRHVDRWRRASPAYNSADGDCEDREYKYMGLRTSETNGVSLKPQDHMRQIMRVPSAASKKSPHLRPAAGVGIPIHPLHPDRSSAQVASVLSGLGDQGAGGEISGIDGIVSSGHRYTHPDTRTQASTSAARPPSHAHAHTGVCCVRPRRGRPKCRAANTGRSEYLTAGTLSPGLPTSRPPGMLSWGNAFSVKCSSASTSSRTVFVLYCNTVFML